MSNLFINFKFSSFLKVINQSVILLVGAMLFASSASAQFNYSFSNRTRAYEEVVPDSVYINGAIIPNDDNVYNNVPIGFNFGFGDFVDSTMTISANGFIYMTSNGGANMQFSSENLINSPERNVRVITANSQDLHSYETGVCGVKYLGISPNRVTVIQWKNWQKFSQPGNYLMNFQIRLYEGSNRIELCYGNNTSTETSTPTICQVGIRAGNVNSSIGLSTLSTWAAAAIGPIGNSTMPFSRNALPDNGRLFSFTPIPLSTNDISLSLISGLPTGNLCDSSTVNFKVAFRNIGTSPLVPILLTQLIKNGIVQDSVLYTGSLIAGGTSQIACFSGINLRGRGSYLLRVINLTDDDFDLNDTLTQVLIVNKSCSKGGYIVSQSNATYTPLTTSINPLPGIFDLAGTVNLPFTFVFNGQPYSQVTIQNNGIVIPGANSVFSGTLPLAEFRNYNLIAPFGDDLRNIRNVNSSEYRVQYAIEGVAPNRKFIAQFTDLYLPTFLSPPVPDSSTFSFQTIINENQTISFHYGNMFANNTELRPVQIGMNFGSDSTFYHLDFQNPCSPTFENITDAGNISNTAEFGAGVLPINGTLITFTPTTLTTADLSISNVTGVPTLFENCDSTSFTVSALVTNVSPISISGVVVDAYIVNIANGDTVQLLTEVITNNLEPYTNEAISFRNIRINGSGTYRIIISIFNSDAILSNNTFSSAPFGTIVCPIFPYTFSRGIEPFVPIETSNETILIAGPDDDGSFGPFELPFPVLVGYNIQTQYSVGSNGGLAFGNSNASSLGLIGFTDNTIAGLCYDAYIRGSGSYVRSSTIGNTPNRIHIIEWTNQGSYSQLDRNINNTFQIRIAESGEITIHYGNVGPITGSYTPQVGFRLNSDLYNVRRINYGDTSWTNAGSGLSSAIMQLNPNAYPRNGFFYRWTPPIRTSTDIAISDFIGVPANNFCDSNRVTFSAVLSNISNVPSNTLLVVGEVLNSITNTVISSQEIVLTENLPGFGLDTAIFTNLIVPGPGSYKLRVRVLTSDFDTTNNISLSRTFSAITCNPFPYIFTQGSTEYVQLDTNTATRVSPETGSDDGSFGPFLLPFPLMYGSNAYDQISISADGQIRFGGIAGGLSFSNNNSIAAITSDLLIREGESVIYTDTIGEFPNRTFVIEWRNVGINSLADGTRDLNFQIRIDEQGIIRLHYGRFETLTGSYSAQVGLFLNNLQYNLRTLPTGETNWSNNQRASDIVGSIFLDPVSRPSEGFFFLYTPRPSGVTPEVSISVPNSVLSACSSQAVPLNVVLRSNSSFPVIRGTVTATVISPSGSSGTFSQAFTNIVTDGATINLSLGNVGVSELGTYNVNYVVSTINDTVVSNDFATSIINVVALDPAPIITNLSGVNAICGSTPVTLQAPDGASEYLWSNGATTREIAVFDGGTYTVQTRSASGCLSLPSEAIVIDSAVAPVVVNFLATTDRLNVIVNGFSIGATNVGYFWTGGASIGQSNDTISFPASGTYSISFYGVGICGNDTVSQIITVTDGITPIDVAIGLIPGNRRFCQNTATTFTARVTNVSTSLARLSRVVYIVTSPSNIISADSFELSDVLTNGAFVTFTDRILNFTEVGNYSVTAIVRAENDNVLINNTGTETFTIQGAINTPLISSVNSTICSGGTATITTGMTAPGSSYLWSNGDTTQSISVSNAGAYSLRIINGVCTSAVSNEVVIVIEETPAQPTILAVRPLSFCEGDSTILELPTGFTSYAWSDGATTRSTIVRNSASISGTVANSAGCISPASVAVVTTVSSPTIPSFSFVTLNNQNKVIVTNTSTNSSSHLFRFSSGTSSQNIDTISFSTPGTYAITLISSNACGSDSITQNVVLSSKISGISKYVSVYPNPTNSILNIDFGTLKFSEATITLLDVTGKVVLTTSASRNTNLDITSLPAAVYNLRLAIAGETPTNFRVVKQ